MITLLRFVQSDLLTVLVIVVILTTMNSYVVNSLATKKGGKKFTQTLGG